MAESFFSYRVYPFLVSRLGNPPPVQALRQRIVPLANGVVLEIGVGPGFNFPYYDPDRVDKIFALEPNPAMIRLAERHFQRSSLVVEFIDLPGEKIPLPDGVVDTAVSTFTLCTIPGIMEAIRGLRRVLKPSGQLLFIEISLSPDPGVRRWQAFWEPFHRRAFAGLHLTRDMPDLITQAGFRIEQLELGYLTEFPKSWAHCCWGQAVP